MRFMVAAVYLVGLIGPAICQTSVPPAQPKLSEQIRIDSFQTSNRGDNYGIASFIISNTSDTAIESIELTCWVNDDREHGTKVLVWPSRQSIPAHDQQQFSNVNIGLVGPRARPECEVTGTD
jgi:hypothetical protein